MSIELLDTDTDNMEDPLEVEKWSEYVDKYIANDETIPDELKEQLTRKPVFLPRYFFFFLLSFFFIKGSPPFF